MLMILRLPSARRPIWTMTLMAPLICWRMARTGRSSPAISTSVSRREKAFPGTISVDGADRAVVSGVHCLQHVQRLAATHVADEETISAHSNRMADQLAHGRQLLA